MSLWRHAPRTVHGFCAPGVDVPLIGGEVVLLHMWCILAASEGMLTVTFTLIDLGQLFRSLRGKQPQRMIAEMAGVDQTTVSALERAETQNPSFVSVVRVGATLGLSPNHIAHLMGLWAHPDELAHEVDPSLALVHNQLMFEMSQTDTEREYVLLWRGLRSVLRDARERRVLREAEDAIPSIPGFPVKGDVNNLP